jgi:tight adherence protein B
MAVVVLSVVASVLAGGGVWLLWSSLVDPPPVKSRRAGERRRPTVPITAEAATGVLSAAVVSGVAGWALFAGVVPAAALAAFGATFPLGALRRRDRQRRLEAAGSWPRVLEEIRMRTGSLGRSIPQALWESGRHGPDLWLPAFRAAEREWMLTTDLERTLALLRHLLDDPTADVVCETLLTAQELGGADLDLRLADLIEDRMLDAESRRDAESRLAGVRFARRFVLLVPLGMTLAGLTIGTGRQAYSSAGGQLAVLIGVVAVAGCWWWSGRLMRLPEPPRTFQ